MDQFCIDGRLRNILFQLAHYFSISDNFIVCCYPTQLMILKEIENAFSIKINKKITNERYCNRNTKSYYQSENCFNVEKIRNIFQFSKKFKNKLNDYIKDKDFSSYCSITCRRGDYITLNSIWKSYPASFYENVYRTYFPSLTCLISSDDMDWCVQNIHISNAIFIDKWLSRQSSLEIMYVLSLCKGHICSPSSFSWWCSWFNETPDTVNIFPNEWYNKDKIPQFLNNTNKQLQTIDQIIPERWLTYDIEKQQIDSI